MARYRFALLVLVMTLTALPASAAPASAPPGFDSAFGGESAFVTLRAGETANFQVFFLNLGTTAWTRGSATEVVLAVCVDTPMPQGFRCNVLSPYADWALNWTSTRIYTTATQTTTASGSLATLSYSVKVPTDAALGDYYFRGELVHRATGTPLHPVGYYQLVTVVP
jgi:hypothetical protein